MALFNLGALSGRAVTGVIIFTVVEYAGLNLWLLGTNVHITTLGQVALAGFLLLEHLIATAVGQQDNP